MKTENIIAVVVFALIGAVLVSAFIPAVASTQITAGTTENYENESVYFKVANATETVEVSYASSVLTLNGETVTPENNSNVLLSDAFSVDQFLFEGNWLTRTWYKDSTTLSYPSAFSLTFSDGVVTGSITAGGVTSDFDDTYSYLYYADEDGKYTQMSGQAGVNAYVKDVKDVILSGIYYTGNNDTTYSYVDGVLTLENGYTGSVQFTKELVGLDVWHITGITVNVDDESFTPFRYIVPTEIVGHENTPTSDIVGLLPLVAVMGIMLTVIGAIFVRRV